MTLLSMHPDKCNETTLYTYPLSPPPPPPGVPVSKAD